MADPKPVCPRNEDPRAPAHTVHGHYFEPLRLYTRGEGGKGYAPIGWRCPVCRWLWHDGEGEAMRAGIMAEIEEEQHLERTAHG